MIKLYIKNTIKKKIIIFHGLNRFGFEDAKYIEDAFKVLSKKYPDDIELIIRGRMPLNCYLEILSKANIVIDQTNTYSLGVNGICALAIDKVVMGGANEYFID